MIIEKIFTYSTSLILALLAYAGILTDQFPIPVYTYTENSDYRGLLRFLLFISLFVIIKMVIRLVKGIDGIGFAMCMAESYLLATALFEGIIVETGWSHMAKLIGYGVLCGILMLLDCSVFFDAYGGFVISNHNVPTIIGFATVAVIIFFFVNRILYGDYMYHGMIPVLVATGVFALEVIGMIRSNRKDSKVQQM